MKAIKECSKDELIEIMKENVNLAKEIYNRSKELKLFDSQEFMNWQDELNILTFIKKEDLEDYTTDMKCTIN